MSLLKIFLNEQITIFNKLQTTFENFKGSTIKLREHKWNLNYIKLNSRLGKQIVKNKNLNIDNSSHVKEINSGQSFAQKNLILNSCLIFYLNS